MLEFTASLVVFFALHSLPAATGFRQWAMALIGRTAYLALYSALSLGAVAWVLAAAWRAPYVELWPTTLFTALVPFVAMLPAATLLTAALRRPNPVSISFAGGPIDTDDPGITVLVRHPILWAFLLWSASHAIANGDLVSVILFGSLAAFSLGGMRVMERRAVRRGEKAAFAATEGPFLARFKKSLSLTFGLEIIAGITFYGILLTLHEPVIGPSIRFSGCIERFQSVLR